MAKEKIYAPESGSFSRDRDSLKLYQVGYVLQMYTNPEHWDGKREYSPTRGEVFRVGKDHLEARRSFVIHVAPALISAAKNDKDYLFDALVINSVRKIDSVQGHRVTIESKVK